MTRKAEDGGAAGRADTVLPALRMTEEGLVVGASATVAGALPVRYVASPNFDERPAGAQIELLVIHGISLPPGQFGGRGIEDLFLNRLDPSQHPCYAELAKLRVSAHFVIRRDGALLQFVACLKRAWHAGVSTWSGRSRCNDFSVGVELEGADDVSYEDAQYGTLQALTGALWAAYPIVDIVGHSDIAPGRKTDPGPFFDWGRYRAALDTELRHFSR